LRRKPWLAARKADRATAGTGRYAADNIGAP